MKYSFCFLFIYIVFTNNLHAQESKNHTLSTIQREYFIQKANKQRSLELYSEAANYLDSILVSNPKDAPILLYKGDLMLQAKLYSKAVDVYKQLIPLQYEPTITKINLSYALFMNHKTNNALAYAFEAWNNDKKNTNAIVNYFNAQLWNIKTKDAETFLNEQLNQLPKHQTLILKARLHTTKGNFNKGIIYYDSAVNENESKFYIKEFAELLINKKEYLRAKDLIEKNREKLEVSDYKNLIQKLKISKQQYTGTEFSYFVDIANNIRLENKYWWQQQDEKKYQLNVVAGFGNIVSNKTEKSSTQFGQLQVNENWSSSLKGETKISLHKISSNSNKNFTVFTAQQLVRYQPNDRRMVGVYVRRELLNFTSSLLDKGIISTSYGYITHVMLQDKIGFFSEGSFSNMSDKNKKLQFFGSLYKLFRTEPTLKTGLNFTALHFSDSSIKNYFSPNRYLHTEVFVDFSTTLPQSNTFFLQVQAATGFQKIENSQWESASRLQTEIGYRKKQIETTLKFQTSNVISNNGAGYSFYWYTLNFRLKL